MNQDEIDRFWRERYLSLVRAIVDHRAGGEQALRIQISDLVREDMERNSAAIQRLWKERDELRQLLQDATEALGRFCSGEDWTQADMETLDRCHARLLG